MEIHSNQKHVKGYQGVDCISNLPDEIRCHILSFLPSKSALKMSILSKQWKHLWTHNPVLDFTEMPFTDKRRLTSHQITHFKNFVYKVLVHNDVPCVQFLNLDLGHFCWDDICCCINSWLDTIAKMDIHKIVITSMHFGQPLVALPANFLSRERLVALTLSGQFSIHDKMSIHLPNLELAHFANLQFPNDEFLKLLLSDCLVLKDLTIDFCSGINNSLFVESLSLRRLHISSVARKTKQAGIVIRTPNLRYLYLDDTSKQHVIGDLRSLNAACLNLHYESTDYALQVLQLISGVTTLRLMHSEYFRYISEPLIFQNVTRLILNNASKLCTILGCTTKLKCLIFPWGAYADESLESEAVPICVSRLEVVHFHRFRGKEEGFKLAAYFLKFGSMLKEMKIFIKSPLIVKADYKKLKMIPRSSPSCRLIFTRDDATKDPIMFGWDS